jgi:anti-sigma28 factor (negative regulator of flagellin synthesis)
MMTEPQTTTDSIDTRRVQLLRSRIADADYEVDPRQIADKIIDLEVALFRRHPCPS